MDVRGSIMGIFEKNAMYTAICVTSIIAKYANDSIFMYEQENAFSITLMKKPSGSST